MKRRPIASVLVMLAASAVPIQLATRFATTRQWDSL